jgi:hydroxymethylbilane synthase
MSQLEDNTPLIIGTRGSKLALWQAEHVKEQLLEHFPALDVQLKVISTKGDEVLDKPLAEIGSKGLFTAELEEALKAKTIDLAVHSLKDLPTSLDPVFKLAAILKRENPRDVFLSEKFESFAQMPKGSKVGTSSIRRKVQLQKYYPHLDIVDIRGNIDTRMAKLQKGDYDAIVLAAAGLIRLGLFTQHMKPLRELVHAPGQGAIAIQTLAETRLDNYLSKLHDEKTDRLVRAERSLLKTLEGGCHVPIGAEAVAIEHGYITLTGYLADVNGAKHNTHIASGTDPEALGVTVANLLRP